MYASSVDVIQAGAGRHNYARPFTGGKSGMRQRFVYLEVIVGKRGVQPGYRDYARVLHRELEWFEEMMLPAPQAAVVVIERRDR